MAAMDNAAEHVAAQLVDSERVLKAHSRQWYSGTHAGISVGSPEWTRGSHDDVRQQNHGADPEAEGRLPP
jgi:hypothetical protein